MKSRKYPSTSLRTGTGHAGGRLREWLARWLKVGKAQRLRSKTWAEALTIAYRHKLVTELHNLKILNLAKPFERVYPERSRGTQGRPFDLETSYVPLRLRPSTPRLGSGQALLRTSSGQALQVREYNGRGEFTMHLGEGGVFEPKSLVGGLRPSGSMTPEEALLRFHHLAVLGDPGAGKTTLLRYLALLTAQGKLENWPDFPILVPLGHFAAVPQINLLDFVISEIETRYGFPRQRPEPCPERSRRAAEGQRPDGSTDSPRWPAEGLRPYLEKRLETGSVLFLLDGLDEANVDTRSAEPFVPLRAGLTTKPWEAEATYRHVVGQINVLAARYPNCPIVVTARRGSWKGLLAASFHTLEVLGFNRDDIQRFIANWFDVNSDRARDLKGALSQNPRMWALAANPLLLSLMAFVFEQDGQLPEGRVGLYERGAGLLLSTADGEDLTDIEHKRSLLEEVALHFHLRRVFLLPEDELKGIIADCLPAVLSKARPEPFDFAQDKPRRRVEGLRTGLEEIIGQHGLLQEQAIGWYGFPHPTWQEYFAAAAISKRGRLKNGEWRIEEGLHDPWWEGTVLFLSGILEDATPLLEGILAQGEDIFYSNLLLAGRCLAGVSRIERVDLYGEIIERLKRLVEGEYHRRLQRQAISVLAEIGGEAVVSFFVALLRRGKIDLNVRAEVAKILGALHDKSAVPDLLAFLTDEELDPSVRGNIAEALGCLGDESVIPPLLALLPDETVDPSVRERVVEALVSLDACPEPGRRGGSIVSPLLAFLPDEGIDPHVRKRISSAVLMTRHEQRAHDPSTGLRAGGLSKSDKSVVSQLLSFLLDKKIHPSVRRGVAEAVGSLGDESAIPDLLALLSDEKVDSSVRAKAAEALGALGAESAVPPLLAILGDEKVDYSVRMTVAEVLGVLGENSASQLLSLLSDERIDPDVRASIAGALGILGEKSVVPPLLSLLPDERIDPAVRWRIVDALISLGDQTIIPHLRALLPNEKIDSSVRWMVAEALESLTGEREEKREITANGERRMEQVLSSLDDRSRVPQLLALLTDERLEPSVSGRMLEALESLGDDRAAVEGLAALLDREDIGSRVYEALFRVSQRAGMRVFARKGGGYEVRPLGTSK